MSIKEKDFVKINFTGKTIENNEIFDTTLENVAEEAGILDSYKTYGPLPIIVGAGHLIPGLDEEIIGMDVGDKKTVILEPEKAYGERDKNLVQIVPMKEFKKQNIKPYVGMELTMENQHARVINISSGRVRLDFNHVLAGKTVEYDLEVVAITESDIDKVKDMIRLHYPTPKIGEYEIGESNAEVDIIDGVVKITLDDMFNFDETPLMSIHFAKFRIAKDIWDNVENITKVEFIDSFENPEKSEEVNDAEPEETPEKIPEVLDDE